MNEAVIKCPQCGVYVNPIFDNKGIPRCPNCGIDLTEALEEIDPELVERISHSSIHFFSELKGQEQIDSSSDESERKEVK